MIGLEDTYSPEELATIEAAAQHGLEACAEAGDYIPYETHLMLAEHAFLSKKIAELIERMEALAGILNENKLEATETSEENEILSTF